MRGLVVAALLMLCVQSGLLSANDGSVARGTEAVSQLLDINLADAARLAEVLPGIGPAKAALIVEWRTQNGHFTKIDQLQQVKGIGPKTVDKLRAYVRIGSGAAANRFIAEERKHERQAEADISRIFTSVKQAAMTDTVRSLPTRPWYRKSALELLSLR